MKIQYTCPDGSLTLATCPATALLHWYMRGYNTLLYKREIPDKKSFEFLNKALNLILERYSCDLTEKEVNLAVDTHDVICCKVLEWLYSNTDAIETLTIDYLSE